MSARSRGRQNPNQDADEERRLWKEIDDKAKGVDALVSRSNEIGEEIIQVEIEQAAIISAGNLSDASLDERLEKLYRENVKLSEEVNHIIEGKSNDMNLLDSINILAGLREASEESAAQLLQASHSNTGRNASGKLSRGGPNKKGNASANLKSSVASTPVPVALSTEDEPSAAPSPRIIIGGPGRLSANNAKDKSSRSGSIATTREASVKIEDGAESVASSADGVSSHTPASTSKGSSASAAAAAAANARGAHRLVLKLGEIVFCRHLDTKDENIEGEGILCRVTNVIGEGKQRRYEVQDADTSGDPPPPQRASVAQLIQIPHSNVGLGDLPKGRHVIAQYPDTTTFYKAEVNEAWKARENESKNGLVRLNFQEDEETREVERRFVLNER